MERNLFGRVVGVFRRPVGKLGLTGAIIASSAFAPISTTADAKVNSANGSEPAGKPANFIGGYVKRDIGDPIGFEHTVDAKSNIRQSEVCATMLPETQQETTQVFDILQLTSEEKTSFPKLFGSNDGSEIPSVTPTTRSGDAIKGLPRTDPGSELDKLLISGVVNYVLAGSVSGITKVDGIHNYSDLIKKVGSVNLVSVRQGDSAITIIAELQKDADIDFVNEDNGATPSSSSRKYHAGTFLILHPNSDGITGSMSVVEKNGDSNPGLIALQKDAADVLSQNGVSAPYGSLAAVTLGKDGEILGFVTNDKFIPASGFTVDPANIIYVDRQEITQLPENPIGINVSVNPDVLKNTSLADYFTGVDVKVNLVRFVQNNINGGLSTIPFPVDHYILGHIQYSVQFSMESNGRKSIVINFAADPNLSQNIASTKAALAYAVIAAAMQAQDLNNLTSDSTAASVYDVVKYFQKVDPKVGDEIAAGKMTPSSLESLIEFNQ